MRARLTALAAGDMELLFAFRRKVYKELTYDERGKPMARKRLKATLRGLAALTVPLGKRSISG